MEENRNKKEFWKGTLCGALAVLFVVVIGMTAKNYLSVSKAGQSVSNGKSKIELLEQLIDEKFLYSDEVDQEALEEGAYAGYIEALGDPYTIYRDAKETEKYYSDVEGEFYGIGVLFSQNMETKLITAVYVYEDTPAIKAGVQAGDILYEVDGTDVTDMNLDDVVTLVRGEENTNVHIAVLRGEKKEKVEMDITRGKIQSQTVHYEMKEDGIGYIRITEFSKVTYEQFQTAFDALEEQDMKGLIVDVRNNPGGLLDAVCEILDQLLPEGKIVYTKDKDGNEKTQYSDAEHQFTKPLCVLADQNSASASEIFVGAIQDYGIGTIIGKKTFGKGIVQSVFPISDGSSVTMTTMEYYTPNGRNIHKKGIEPDIEVDYQYDEANPDADNQLDAALEEIRKKLDE
ncbi:MAG: S41 family peptidase [Bariatricus sp.]